MKADYYSVLGVAPTSEDVVIQAAYRALMRRYHPDANSSAEAASRARDITAAYAVLGDPGRRARYDSLRNVAAAGSPPDSRGWAEADGRPERRQPSFIFAMASSAALAVALIVLVSTPLAPSVEVDRLPDRTTSEDTAAAAAPDLRPATAVRSISQSKVGTELPPDSRTGDAFIDPTAMAVADPIDVVRPNAASTALGRSESGSSPVAQAAVAPVDKPPAVRTAAAKRSRPIRAAAQPAADEISASFSCRVASTRGEKAVCGNADLAALDRRNAIFYAQSYGQADADRRARLLSTRERFIAKREECRSDSCISEAYLGHMREISDVMAAGAR